MKAAYVRFVQMLARLGRGPNSFRRPEGAEKLDAWYMHSNSFW